MPQQTLQAWNDVLGSIAGNPGKIAEIDCASVDGQLHVCTRNSDGRLWHTIRFNDSWQTWGDVLSAVPGDPGDIVEVDCASVGGQLHLCARDINGRLWHTIRFNDSWQAWGDVLGAVAGNPGNIVEFNCAGIGSELHLCARDINGRLWHTIRFSDSWQAWGDVLSAVAGNPGNIVEFNCAGIGSALHLCARNSSGRLWHTIRFSDSWQAWGDVLGTVVGNIAEGVEVVAYVEGGQQTILAFVRSVANLWVNWWDPSTGTWRAQDQGKLWNTSNQSSVLNGDIDRLGRMPSVVTGSTSLGQSQKPIDSNGVAYTLTEERRRLVNEVVEHAFLQDIAAMGVWPGQVIQSKALLSGDVAAIGPFPRQPGTIQITTDLISTTPRSQSVSINAPDAANVNAARRDLIKTINPTNSAGLLKTSYERAYTMREVGVKAGLSVKGANFNVDANATFDETYKSTVVVVVIRQIFYSVTFTPQSSEASGFWPDGQVSYQNLAPYVGAGNPPLYVDSVQYGRFICVTVQGSFSSTDITAALRGTYKAAVEGSLSLDFKYKNVLENSQVRIYTIGVPGYGNFQDISSIDDLQKVYKSGLSFSPQNPGAPISFTCRHIADNSLAKVGLAAEYTQPLSAVGKDINQQRFQVYDGPGGGFVSTQIRVNSGDKVRISASGIIKAGFFWGIGDNGHGPQGWGAGHPPDPSAPLPTASGGTSAYCLLHRFGSSGKWIETMNLWEDSVPPGIAGGTLQLNINDNNTQNGDPALKWTVLVDVKRSDAGSTGIYV